MVLRLLLTKKMGNLYSFRNGKGIALEAIPQFVEKPPV